ncbi:MFS transporter [Paenarthrobacter sp. Z7-10]|uniref:MFS transporter n=1 Tax=Paenarthrobacter sp. Z7-10 TaxID=2787635 RepID=UPI0022A9CFEB|nr:MFS transporter [Paenarthrobacter sp. Z7-10]
MSFLLAFGWISLLGDFVYEGARSVTGPLLASLGASAAAVGAITGAGEAAALLLRLASGPLADRTRRFWTLAIGGYVLTVLAVPLLGFSSALWVGAALVIAERVGKAVRSPAKDTMLSHAASSLGRGKGFALQEAMDQIGAVAGPLSVALMLSLTGTNYGPSLLVLAVPGAGMIAILLWLRRRMPFPQDYEPLIAVSDIRTAARGTTAAGTGSDTLSGTRARLPAAFWQYSIFTALTISGMATFGVLAFHMTSRGIVPAPLVPLVYAAAMAVDAAAALASGWLYDRCGAAVLAVLPVVAALLPGFAFANSLPFVVLGALLWGCATGLQESTLRALVADLVPPGRRATAYGIFAAVIGVAALAGGTAAGVLYQVSIPALVLTTVIIQAAALALLGTVLRRQSRAGKRSKGGEAPAPQ